MPTYEYLCSACNHHWEEVQKISEPALEVCPNCSKSTAKRQISGGNFILKGGGWYADLYSSSSGNKKKESEAGANGAAPKSDSKDSSASSATSTAGASSSSSPSSLRYSMEWIFYDAREIFQVEGVH